MGPKFKNMKTKVTARRKLVLVRRWNVPFCCRDLISDDDDDDDDNDDDDDDDDDEKKTLMEAMVDVTKALKRIKPKVAKPYSASPVTRYVKKDM